MNTEKIMRMIAQHILETTNELDKRVMQDFTDEIKKARRIFVYGAGRSGLVSRAFAMRLVQLGLTSYVIGETVTPGLKKGDLLILVSGSGETKLVLSVAKTAKELGVKIASITSYPKSTLGKLSDITVQIKGKSRVDIEKDHLRHQIEGIHSSLTPLGTLFEDTTLIFLDGVIGRLMVELNKDEGEMKKRHASV
ncbi:MAG: 6-phospho-3-hexuloisomerase [Candidatus Altiarchaeales archaeon]|nr:6-phospho-3-hexuloisomerase [Candidatus Altiarchaeales archaeon]